MKYEILLSISPDTRTFLPVFALNILYITFSFLRTRSEILDGEHNDTRKAAKQIALRAKVSDFCIAHKGLTHSGPTRRDNLAGIDD